MAQGEESCRCFDLHLVNGLATSQLCVIRVFPALSILTSILVARLLSPDSAYRQDLQGRLLAELMLLAICLTVVRVTQDKI
jgi:hypothetical protein